MSSTGQCHREEDMCANKNDGRIFNSSRDIQQTSTLGLTDPARVPVLQSASSAGLNYKNNLDELFKFIHTKLNPMTNIKFFAHVTFTFPFLQIQQSPAVHWRHYLPDSVQLKTIVSCLKSRLILVPIACPHAKY